MPPEAALLGLASGPACLASCGPVLLPWLVAERGGWRRTASQLLIFLGGRLAGYLLFAAMVVWLSAAIPLPEKPRVLLFALTHLGLAFLLTVHVLRGRVGKSKAPALVSIAPRRRVWAPVLLGLITGINLCPPFITAAVRAAGSGSLSGSLLYFAFFFAGTAIWFVPFAALGALRLAESVATVARYTLLALAAYYGYLGLLALLGRFFHG